MTIKFDTTHDKALRDLTAYSLAYMAECGDPDNMDSSGAEFLKSVRDDVLENFLNDSWGTYYEDTIGQLVDSCVPVYTHEIAKAFVDLLAYNEDISDYVDYSGDMIKLMQMSLYVIGDRLANALYNEYRHTLEEQENN
jgi:hypothetical protein